jgi:hypothetical protein
MFVVTAALFVLVTTGLDPVVHAEVRFTMDCRIKSGNDERLSAPSGYGLIV